MGNRAFYRRLTQDSRVLFPRLPERTRLLRLFMTHQAWTEAFLASPTVLGVIDTDGIALIHPMREGVRLFCYDASNPGFPVSCPCNARQLAFSSSNEVQWWPSLRHL